MIKLKKKLIISLMGVDGAGKTTLAKNLHKSIQNSQYLHLKPYIFFLDKRTTIKNPYSQKKSSFLIEKTFGIDGIGLLGFSAIIDRDYDIMMGFIVIGVITRLIGNLISDLTYALIDPRIRFK